MAATDEALRRVFSNDPELTSLDWSRAAVGDDSVCLLAEALAKGVNTHLRALDLRGCTRISDMSARKLLQALPNCSLMRVAVARTSISAPKRAELQRQCAGNQRAADEAAAIEMPSEGLTQLIASMQAQDLEAAAALRNRDRLEARVAELERGGQPVGAEASTSDLQRRLEMEVASHVATRAELEQARRSLQQATERNEELERERREKDATIDQLRKVLVSTSAAGRQEIASLGATSVPPLEAANLQTSSVGNEKADRLREVFARADRNGDGNLTRSELILRLREDTELALLLQLPQRVGDDERDVFEPVFQGMDQDDDRTITSEEFVAYCMSLPAAFPADDEVDPLQQDTPAVAPATASLPTARVDAEGRQIDATPAATKKPPPPESKPPSPPLLAQDEDNVVASVKLVEDGPGPQLQLQPEPDLEPDLEPEPEPEAPTINPLTVDARRTFDSIDKDGSGSISYAELSELAQKMEARGHDPRPLRSILTQLDVDRSGEIDFDEWQHLWTNLSSFCSQQSRQMFNMIDVSGDGSVSMHELQARMESLPARSRGQWQAVMHEMDKDGSGEIEFVEFDAVVGKWIRAKLLLGLEAALDLEEKTAKTPGDEDVEDAALKVAAELEPTDSSSDIEDIELSEDETDDLDASAGHAELEEEPQPRPPLDSNPQDLSESVEGDSFAFDEDEIDGLVASAGGEDLEPEPEPEPEPELKPKLETKPSKPPPPMPSQQIEPRPLPQPHKTPSLAPGAKGGATDSNSSSRKAETPKDNLLRWAQERSRSGTEMRGTGAAGEIPEPKGFRKGFADGLVFCAILAAEGHLDWTEVSLPVVGAEGGMLNAEQKLANLQLAFGIADRVLGLDGEMLEAQDMATDGQYDEKSVMTYVGELRKHLRKHASTAGGSSTGDTLKGTSTDGGEENEDDDLSGLADDLEDFLSDEDEIDEDEINALISSAGAEI